MKGIIASDIDGTLTDSSHIIPKKVANYLEELHQKGWAICLITGRMFSFAKDSVVHLNFPYFLALQNGAEILSMPERKILFQHFLTKKDLLEIQAICEKEHDEDFLLYAGYEKGDFCYYRTSRFSPSILFYLEKLKQTASKPWQEVVSMKEVSQDAFPLIKYLGKKDELKKIEEKLKKHDRFSLSTLIDTLDKSLYILLITSKLANKGEAIRFLINTMKWKGPVIAAGDQSNDIPLFLEADYSIAMEDGDEELKRYADIIASSASEMGIIPALQKLTD
jgi:Cof subfamily protein (haloacid dehalogenase superfamily)